MKTTFDLYFLIGMITLVLSFIFYFVLTSKNKAKDSPIMKPQNKIKELLIRKYRICDYFFTGVSWREAVIKMQAFCKRKGLNFYLGENGRGFIYLNERNKIRKLKSV